jgi:hypothetical protein
MHKQFPDIPLPPLIISVRGKLRSYRLARNLDDNSIPESIFWLPNKPPEGWNVTEEEWERGIALCLQARVLGGWYGDDILHPIPMTEQMNKYIDKWRSEQCLRRINSYLDSCH